MILWYFKIEWLAVDLSRNIEWRFILSVCQIKRYRILLLCSTTFINDVQFSVTSCPRIMMRLNPNHFWLKFISFYKYMFKIFWVTLWYFKLEWLAMAWSRILEWRFILFVYQIKRYRIYTHLLFEETFKSIN